MAWMCALCLTVSAAAPAALADETEAVSEADGENADGENVADGENADGESADGEESADDADAADGENVADEESTDAEDDGENLVRPKERPDYRALDYVTLGQYKGLVVQVPPMEVTEEEIDAAIRSNIQAADALDTLTEGTVQLGDIANIDYVGKLNGEAFDGGTDKGYDLAIGSGTFIDGFEDGLIGVAVGDTVDLPLTFPENYGNTDLAGQEVVFTVTVNEVRRMPEVTDELVSLISDGEYTAVASYRESVRADLEEQEEQSREGQIKMDLYMQLASSSEIKGYPQELVDFGVTNMEVSYRETAEAYSMEFEDYLEQTFGMNREEFLEEAEFVVKQNIEQELYLKAIAESEGMEVSDEEYEEYCESYAAEYGYDSPEALVADYGESTVRVSVLQTKALDFLLENTIVEEVEETEMTPEEAMEAESGEAVETESGSEEAAETESSEPAEAESGEIAETESGETAETETADTEA